MKLKSLAVASAMAICSAWAYADSTVSTTVDGDVMTQQLVKLSFDKDQPDMVTLHFDNGSSLTADLGLVSAVFDHSGSVSIDEIIADPAKQSGVYNLKGQRVADTPEGLAPGVYVANGVKIYVK